MITIIVSSLIFIVSLWLIFSEKLHRTIVAAAGAAVMVGLGKLLQFYSEEAAIAAIDFNTIGLLLGMMILVALLEPTGFFQYLAVWAARLSRGRPVRRVRPAGEPRGARLGPAVSVPPVSAPRRARAAATRPRSRARGRP